ncbi:MAG: DUF4358 domain-containing protein [Clostridia bacterium]|nr:DUF4358 domain-containing protein [Clostridia bacterium]
MKKIITLLLIAVMIFAVVSCTDAAKPADTSKTTEKAADTKTATEEIKETEAATEKPADIVVPDVKLTYVPADVYADKDGAASAGYKEASKVNLADWFMDKKELDSNFEFIIPDQFSMLEGYVLRIPQGKAVMEIDVFKVTDKANAEQVAALAEKRYEKLKSSDWKLYDDEQGSNAKIIDTGKIEAVGNFVIFTLTNDSETSMLRAKKQILDNPTCSAIEVYKAITSDLSE